MPRIVFSPLVAMRFLRWSARGIRRAGVVSPIARHRLEIDSNCPADTAVERGALREPGPPHSWALSPRLARHIAEGPREPGDWDESEFEQWVRLLASWLVEAGAGAEGAAKRAEAPAAEHGALDQNRCAAISSRNSLLEKFHEDLDCERALPAPEPSWVLRARGAREAGPLVELLSAELVERGVRVGARLPALGHAEGLARASECLGRDFAGTRVRVGFVRGHLLELAFAVPGCFGHEDEQALEAATIYAEAVLGEERLDEWVGSIGVSPAPRGGVLRVMDSAGQGAAVTPLSELAGLVERGVQGLLAGLPSAPLACSDSSDWTLLEAEPLCGEDGAPSALGMDDALMAATRCPELLKCFLEGLPVSSRRFSRALERFVYLKLPSALPLSARPEARAQVERALEPHLRQYGVIIGNAVGVQHLYVVLALRELVPALEALLDCALAHPCLFPRGSQLRFLDATWANEWLALYA